MSRITKAAVMQTNQKQYPGGSATAEQILRLAEEYRKAAHLLVEQGRRRDPLSWAPCRLSAIHAIELFLNAFLLHKGQESTRLRGMQHDLATRAEMAVASGLQFRKLTIAHLAAIAGKREYLITRYGPEMTATVSQINRLIASLEEVAIKVTTALCNPR